MQHTGDPLGTASLAFHAQVDGLTAEKLEKALSKDRTLILWTMLGAPHVVPQPTSKSSPQVPFPWIGNHCVNTLGGWASALDKADLDPFQVIDKLVGAANKQLDGKSMDVNELRDRLYAGFESSQNQTAGSPPGTTCPEPLFRALGTMETVCIVSRSGHRLGMARTDQWLKRRPTPMDPAEAAGLARRFATLLRPEPTSISPSGLNAAWRMHDKRSSSSRKSSSR